MGAEVQRPRNPNHAVRRQRKNHPSPGGALPEPMLRDVVAQFVETLKRRITCMRIKIRLFAGFFSSAFYCSRIVRSGLPERAVFRPLFHSRDRSGRHCGSWTGPRPPGLPEPVPSRRGYPGSPFFRQPALGPWTIQRCGSHNTICAPIPTNLSMKNIRLGYIQS